MTERSWRFAKLEDPVRVPLADTFVVSALLDQEKGRDAIHHAVRDGFLRPFDIGRADIEEPRPLWVPFWRTEVLLDGLHVTLSNVGSGLRYKEAVAMVCARTDFPYAPKLSSRLGWEAMTRPAEREMLEENGAEILDADVDSAGAKGRVLGLLLRTSSPAHAIYPTYEPKIRPPSFCLYPVYFARYAYSGEGSRYPGEELFVAVSGVTGEVVAARNPSAARSVAAKLRRLLSFDRRT